jgi:hypothetical protein
VQSSAACRSGHRTAGLRRRAVYDLKERQAQMIRRYVLQWEIAERHRLRDLGDLQVAS